MIHPNSIAAWHSLNLSAREESICAHVEKNGVMTDREINTTLGFMDMNHCRPSISVLIEKGALREHGYKVCPVTKRTVRTVYLGNGVPMKRGPAITDHLIAYFRIAERERQHLMYDDKGSAEWAEAAEVVNRLI